MIIFKILGFFLILAFMLGVLSGFGLLGITGYMMRQFKQMTGLDMSQSFGKDKKHPSYDDNDVDLIACPHCGTYTNAKDHKCEACGKRI